MNWLSAVLSEWYEHSRLLYACVTVGAMAGIGLLFALLGSWALGKLGVEISRMKHE